MPFVRVVAPSTTVTTQLKALGLPLCPANRVTIRRARNASARPCGPGFLFTKDLAIELTNRAGLS